jgi:hypothetical protein
LSVLLGSVVFLGLLLAPSAFAQSSTTVSYASAVAGTISPSGTTDSEPSGSLATSAAVPARGVRRIPHGTATATPLVAARPQATGVTLTSAPPSLLANFNGVSSGDSAVTNFGQEF